MTAPREVLEQLLSAAQADALEAAGRNAWSAAASALRLIMSAAPEVRAADGQLVMPDEIAGSFSQPHLVAPLELSTNDDRTALAYLVASTSAAAEVFNSQADEPSDEEQQTLVVSSTVLGQVIQGLNLQVFASSAAGLVLSTDDMVANSMPAILETMDEPGLLLKLALAMPAALDLKLFLPGTFLDIVANALSAPGSEASEDDRSASPAGTSSGLMLTAEDLDMAELIEGEDEDEAGDEEDEPAPVTPFPSFSTPVAPPPRHEAKASPPPPPAQRAQFTPLPEPDGPAPRNGIDLLAGLRMNVTVELGRTELTVAEVLGLGPGSVIELDRLAGEPVDILVNDRLIARGEVVVVDENFGVRVVEVVRRGAEQEEAVH